MVTANSSDSFTFSRALASAFHPDAVAEAAGYPWSVRLKALLPLWLPWKGRYYWNKRTATDIKTAISYFNQAIDKDPSYAIAYSGLADAYGVLPSIGSNANEVFPKSNAAAKKALELDPTLARPRADLAKYKWEHDWDFSGGEAEYRKALELDPSDATAHQWFAQDLAMIGGRSQEAIPEANRAAQLDPLSPIVFNAQVVAYLSDRQFDKAIEVSKKIIADNPTFGFAHG
jgi:tetratricopeptide (TPR) repeat protein